MYTKDDIVIPNFDLTGKVAIVTGGTKGLGYGIALTYAAYGADVVVAARTVADCERVSQEIRDMGRKSLGVPCDLSKVEETDRLIETVANEFGHVDIVVCNAGGARTVKAINMSEDDWDYVMDLDLKAVAFTAKAAAKQMIKQGTGGKIIAMASAAAMGGSAGISIYCAAKAGVVNLVKAFAVEWARYGITVNAICPGYVPTAINEASLKDERVRKAIESHSLVRRLGRVEEIAAPALYLASNFSDYMTGAYILVDGGGAAAN